MRRVRLSTSPPGLWRRRSIPTTIPPDARLALSLSFNAVLTWGTMQFNKLKRREFITLVGGAAAAGSITSAVPAMAQQPGKLPRVGVLLPADSDATPILDAFRKGLRDLGYVEAKPFPSSFRRAAGYVDRILRGTNPGDLPIDEPATFDLVVNLRTARSLGIAISPDFISAANEVDRIGSGSVPAACQPRAIAVLTRWRHDGGSGRAIRRPFPASGRGRCRTS
jgi:hypothetical protein